MAKIKHTKNELKAQRDALRRFKRYLPTLQLKKQQLQMEMRRLEQRIDEVREEEDRLMSSIAPWIRLFALPVDLASMVVLKEVRTTIGNIAGVNIPVLQGIEFEPVEIDLHATDPWIDDARAAIEQRIRLQIEREILAEQHRLLGEELRITTQRVNLFEKVKIPEAQANIRIIRIFLGDQQTAEVARAKIAKSKTAAAEAMP
ncbi:MAG: V-type ATP synthase subunit D [Kiritimatiellae bacterium]|nr:V-type ATP synthase subunit D [Kiritimatiellia bacterium]MDW8457925.1 V-type ATP synthase subunit D [Verrucomicrobiota bacterium]